MEVHDSQTYVSKIWHVAGYVGPLEINLTWKLFRNDGDTWKCERTLRFIRDDHIFNESEDTLHTHVFISKDPDQTEATAVDVWELTVRRSMKMIDHATLEVCEIHTSNAQEVLDKLSKTRFAHLQVIENPHTGDAHTN